MMRTAPLKTGARLLAVPHAAVAHSAMQTTRMFEQQRIRVPRAPAPRMTVPRATSVDSYMPEPIEQAPSVERVEPQLGGAVGQIGSFAVKFVLDAFKMLQSLVLLLERIRTAAASIQSSSSSSSSGTVPTVAPPSPPTLPVAATSLLSVATMSAVTHLRQTLTDATGTLEAKWRALDGTAAQRNGLFAATHASATALDALQASSGEATPRQWSQNSTAVVMEEEEALRRSVFLQVYAELNAQAKKNSGEEFVGYCPA